ncbi:gluconate 2-dehydrogenase subunit 3 family protein [Ginsengibacter hankyongi]|uniref:Gluconate 2-dehydrogenase subunit 3 family protein n=1 Tax=Ginsengibacter hankyongi TaxID=2607284 RepID=A0A5J5IHA4_9BACT|nr:gluconate 2-dehydrogenase subunit 3 family protein [Ginsengibacter hankyongi]KAA9038031.1 gluconate 2-dehydrogenase subunit 3 family protein [Ginsengibacter hankyongi]
MDRRKSLKAIALGTVSTGMLLDACKLADKKEADNKVVAKDNNDGNPTGINRMKEEAEHYKEVTSTTFFTPEEMATITVLGDIIIPKDDVSGSASDAKVPEFIEFIVKDKPEHQVPMRGGLRWLDLQCYNRYQNSFKDCNKQQQIEMVDEIAFPKKAKPEMKQGVAFFNLMRNLTATGFYTSEIGGKDVGYMGNTPNQWNGVPADVLKQYNLAYTDKELKECISFS